MKPFQDGEFLEMSWNGHAVVTRWKKLCLSYDSELAPLVILLAQHEGSQWIDDTTGTGCFFSAYTIWLRDVLLPPLVAAGLKRFAFVLPDYFSDAQARISEEDFSMAGLEVKAFNRRAKADEWIQRS
jgi:hypothetical protein